jgi:alkylation response protein AidB-like acyl-CoA dehydrogenase
MVLSPFKISTDLLNQLRQYNAAAEAAATLIPQQLDIIYQQKWFKLFVPKQYDGLELGLLDGLQIEEDLARIDGSLGWTVTLCSGATMFAGYLSPAVNEKIFKDEKVCFGGSGRANGIAQIAANGYRVSGKWPYATGTPHCTIFTANCQLEKEGQLLKGEDGNAVIRSFFFYKNDVTTSKDWDMMGLKATAGHAFEVEDVAVPFEQSFLIDGDHATHHHPVYTYPFLQFAEATLVVNTLGMCMYFMELCEDLIKRKTLHHPGTLSADKATFALPGFLDECALELLNLRSGFYKAVKESWDDHLAGNKNAVTLENVSSQSRRLVLHARLLVEKLYPFFGLEAARTGSEINRVWRDIHTASQHSLLLEPIM